MRNRFLATIAAVAIFVALAPVNATAQPYDARAFQKAQAAGKTTVMHVGAAWCSTCKRQGPILHALEEERSDLVVYEVDFDTAKDVLRHFRVRYQTTLIVFKGKREIARSVGETDAARIRALVAMGF